MSVNYGTSIVTDGLILLLDPLNPRSYVSPSSSWYDLSVDKYTTTLSGSYSYNLGGYLNFDGSTGSATVSANTTLAAVTMIAWINSAANQSAYTGVFIARNSANFGIVISGYNTNSVNTMWNSAGYNFNTGLVIPNTQWCMVAGIASAGNALTTYLNNTSFSTSGTYATQAMTNPIIGNDTAAAGRYFHGSIGPIMVYNRNLSATEMAKNFNAYRGRYGI